MSATGFFNYDYSIKETLASGVGPAAVKEHRLSERMLFEAGTGNAQIDVVGSKTATISSASDLDLTSLDNLAGSFAPAYIHSFAIRNRSTTATLTVGAASSNAWEPWVGTAGDSIKIPPGCTLVFTAPLTDAWGFNSSTAKQLLLTPSASLTYDLIMAGRSA